MKIFIYDENRVLMRTVGTPDIMQGENNATLIFMSVAGIDETNFQNYLAQFAATIGTSHPADIITDFGPYVLDGVTYYGWKYFVSSKFTQVAGVLNANLVLSSGGSTLISQTVSLNVNPSASGVTWFKNITQAQWEQLLAYCVGLRNPNLGVVDTSADPNILDDYNSEAQLGAYLFVEAQNGNLCLLTVGYDDNDEAIVQNVLSVHGSALYISYRMYEDGEWTAWTTADGASAISVQASHFQRIPGTANKVQSALQAIDELMPNNFILADDYCVNLAGHNLSDDGYTFTQSGNDYIIGLPSGENINDWLWRMCGVRRIIPSPTISDDPVTIVTKKGAVFTMYKSGANYILKAQVTFVLYDAFKDFVDDLGESVATKSLLVKNGSITNFRVNNTQFLANEGGNTHLINSTGHTFTDNGNTYKFPYPSGTTQTDAEKKLATLQMILDLSDQSDGRYVHDFDMSLDGDYVLTITLKDYEGNILRTRTVDFPAEMAMVDASYDNVTKDLTFTLQNGNTVTVPLDDIISGLATETYVTDAISTALADYVTASALNTALSSYATLSYATATFALIGDSYTKAESDAKYALGTDLDSTNARVTSLETKTAKNESDIQYLYRQVIGGGDLVTATDSGVSLTSQPFPLTVSPKALLDYVGGMCQKVNQFADRVNKTSNGITISSASNGVYSLSGVATNSYVVINPFNAVSGNSVLVSIKVISNPNNINFLYGDLNNASASSVSPSEPTKIVTLSNAGAHSLGIQGSTLVNTDLSGISFLAYYVDISKIWSTDTPTSTSDPRIQRLMSYLSSHPEYDAGSILTAPVTKVVSKGFNLWDEETELGYIDASGNLQSSNDYIRSKNFFKVFPNEEYYINIPSGKALYFTEYDANGNFIKQTYRVNESTITTQANTAKVKFYMSGSYGTTYKHDICINISNASLNGTYLPYRAPIEYPIPAEVRALDGYGLGIDADCYNYIDFERKKFVKKVARVDLGSLNWTCLNGKMFADLTNAFVMPNTTDISPIVCAKYESSSINNVVNQTSDGIITLGSIGYWGEHRVAVYDSAYSDATAFKAAVSGVYLYYELATPVETDVSEYIDGDVIVVSAGGHLEFENENDMGVPYSATYQCEPETQEGE